MAQRSWTGTKGRFRWHAAREKAAIMLASGQYKQSDVARAVGVSVASITQWLSAPEFKERVERESERMQAEVRAKATDLLIADKRARLERLNQRWMELAEIARERGRHPSMLLVPGGRTGLLKAKVRKGDGGEDVIVETELDSALLVAERQCEREAATILGESAQKLEVSGADGGPVEVQQVGSQAGAWALLLEAVAEIGGSDGSKHKVIEHDNQNSEQNEEDGK